MTKRRSTQIFTASLTAISAAITAAIAVLLSVTIAGSSGYGIIGNVYKATLTVLETFNLQSDYALPYYLLFYAMPTVLSLCAAVILFSKDNGSQVKYVVGNAFALSATLVVATSSCALTLGLRANGIAWWWLFAVAFGLFFVVNFTVILICIFAKAPAIVSADDMSNVVLTQIDEIEVEETEQNEYAENSAVAKRISKLKALYDNYSVLTKEEYEALVNKYLQEEQNTSAAQVEVVVETDADK